jgi:serine/threonine protein phosphatase PrpC
MAMYVYPAVLHWSPRRSLGDLTAATVGCTSDPEVTFTTLRPHTDQVLVMATDGVWDVLTNEQVRKQQGRQPGRQAGAGAHGSPHTPLVSPH